MPRYALLVAALVATANLADSGCRSCSTCHDYDPPVAESYCNAYGTHRCGSASGGGCDASGCSAGGCTTGDCATGYCASGGCSTGSCGCGNDGGAYVENSASPLLEGEYSESYPVETP